MNKLSSIAVILTVAIVITSCRSNLTSIKPHNGKTFQGAISTVQGLKTATTGTYGLFVPIVDGYWRPYSSFILNIGMGMGDNITEGVTTVDALQRVFNFQRTSTDGTLAPFWKHSYKIIYAANQNILATNKLLKKVAFPLLIKK